MKRWGLAIAVVFLAGIITLPAYGDDRLKVTGFVDSHVRATKNLSNNDDNFTDVQRADCDLDGCDEDEQLQARTRTRIFFNVEAFDNAKAVVGIELDTTWGGNASGVNAGGADLGTDIVNVFELKHMYADFKIPGAPVRMELGLFRFVPETLHPALILNMDAAGVAATIDAAAQVQMYPWFMWLTEGFDGLEGGADTGDSYALGMAVRTKPVTGLNLDLLFAYQHQECTEDGGGTACPTSTIRIGPDATVGGFDVVRFDRIWLGLDSRFRAGPLTVGAAFVYLFGTQERRATLRGDREPEADISAFLVLVDGSFQAGPVKISGRFMYNPGDEANDSPLSDINHYQHIAVDTGGADTGDFEIFGINIDSTHEPTFGFNDPRSIRSNQGFDQFGLLHAALKVDFSATPKFILTGAVGFFAAAEDVGRPRRLGTGTDFHSYNYTGEDKYIATELDVWLTYKLFPRTDVQVWFAYAFVGSALDLRQTCTTTNVVTCTGPTAEAQDVAAGGGRMIFRF